VHAKDAIPDLVAMLEHPMAEVRSQAAWALGQMGPEAKDAVKPLAGAVEDGYMGYNIQAIKALGKIGPGAAKSLPVLLKAMSATGYFEVSTTAMQAAVDMSASPKKVVPVLIEALGDPNPEVRWGACQAIRGYGPDAAKAAAELGELLEDPERRNETSWAALAALVSIGPGASGAVDSIIWSLQYLGTREGAGMALRSIGEKAVPAMIEALDDEVWGADDELARVLGQILRSEELEGD
jgi:HEAT repeat protein